MLNFRKWTFLKIWNGEERDTWQYFQAYSFIKTFHQKHPDFSFYTSGSSLADVFTYEWYLQQIWKNVERHLKNKNLQIPALANSGLFSFFKSLYYADVWRHRYRHKYNLIFDSITMTTHWANLLIWKFSSSITILNYFICHKALRIHSQKYFWKEKYLKEEEQPWLRQNVLMPAFCSLQEQEREGLGCKRFICKVTESAYVYFLQLETPG